MRALLLLPQPRRSLACVSLLVLVACGSPPASVDAAQADAAAPVDAASPFDAAALDAGPLLVDTGSPLLDSGSPLVADAGPPALLDAGPAPSFDHIYEDILRPRCARCHIDEPGSRLYMPDVDTAYAALVGVPVETAWASSCGVAPEGRNDRVRPYDLEGSMLSFLPDCYVRDADHGYSTGGSLPVGWLGGMPADERAEVQAWISAGAPRRNFE
jgi:hypothetical protein